MFLDPSGNVSATADLSNNEIMQTIRQVTDIYSILEEGFKRVNILLTSW